MTGETNLHVWRRSPSIAVKLRWRQPSSSPEDATLAPTRPRIFSWLLGILLALVLTVSARPVLCLETSDPGARAALSRILETLKTVPLSDRAEIARLGRTSFDAAAIAKTILGKYWPTASARARAEFVDALSSAMLINVIDLVEKHGRFDLDLGKVRKTMNGDAIVEGSVTKPDGRIVEVDWRLRPCAYGRCVVDVIVNGVSMAIQRRDEAAAILSANNGAIDELSRRLRANPTHPFN